MYVPPGHFYSPVISADEVAKRKSAIWAASRGPLPGIAMNDAGQKALLQKLSAYKNGPEIHEEPFAPYRFHNRNGFFENTDAAVLAAMIPHLRPGRIVEVGGGFSTALMLDVREHRKLDFALTTIEPYPERLRKLLKPDDDVVIVEAAVQDVAPELFRALGSGDILFIDSSHVAKTGSDVNHLFFNVLPLLKRGVFIHLHDIFHPFEYPPGWVLGLRRSWNENYLLRAFLMHNDAYRIRLFNAYLSSRYPAIWKKNGFGWCTTMDGGSFWMEKVGM